MRQHLHTALVIGLLALPAFGQFSEVWTNGDLFAVNEMASQCYSASVERCVAVGVAPDSPSWFDYLLGKNRAKLLSVKANIAAVRPYYVNARTNALDLLKARDSAVWTNDAHFLSDCALPANALSETPYFKSQYASTTGGWVNTYAMLTNMTVSATTFTCVNTNSYAGYGAADFGTWADAKADAENEWGAVNAGGQYPLIASYGNSTYNGQIVNYSAYLGYSGVGTNATKTAYLYSKTVPYYDVGFTAVNTFDPQGTGYTNGWNANGVLSTNGMGAELGLLIGTDNSSTPAIPTWCAEPTTIDGITLGWKLTNAVYILHWTSTTNGFRYR
jgi:hypothetical protein